MRTKIHKYFIDHLDFGINPDFGIHFLIFQNRGFTVFHLDVCVLPHFHQESTQTAIKLHILYRLFETSDACKLGKSDKYSSKFIRLIRLTFHVSNR